ncbi:hypothetical protein BD626DRAFT_231602 [Schizophyllum amplum]|uniref:Uncharacterized protein n=1 Tax=Schizophyllum amplum TaxID=97359 RepID=A0A550BW80_9AGAR|nr:hypothetical protein BD626DRAFT_231602 [Auriculariopsis ampla]
MIIILARQYLREQTFAHLHVYRTLDGVAPGIAAPARARRVQLRDRLPLDADIASVVSYLRGVFIKRDPGAIYGAIRNGIAVYLRLSPPSFIAVTQLRQNQCVKKCSRVLSPRYFVMQFKQALCLRFIQQRVARKIVRNLPASIVAQREVKKHVSISKRTRWSR